MTLLGILILNAGCFNCAVYSVKVSVLQQASCSAEPQKVYLTVIQARSWLGCSKNLCNSIFSTIICDCVCICGSGDFSFIVVFYVCHCPVTEICDNLSNCFCTEVLLSVPRERHLSPEL